MWGLFIEGFSRTTDLLPVFTVLRTRARRRGVSEGEYENTFYTNFNINYVLVNCRGAAESSYKEGRIKLGSATFLIISLLLFKLCCITRYKNHLMRLQDIVFFIKSTFGPVYPLEVLGVPTLPPVYPLEC